jgi:hypothetical protein
MSRRSLAALLFLAGISGMHAASASGCTGSGTLTIALNPCSETLSLTEGAPRQFVISATVAGTVSGTVFVIIGESGKVLSGTEVEQTGVGRYAGVFTTYPGLTPGAHTGTLTIRLCNNQACKAVYAQASVPYSFTVKAVPKPVLSGITPQSASTGVTFTVTATGTNFLRSSSIYFGTVRLSTRFVSAARLTATVGASRYPTGRSMHAMVVTPAPWVSGTGLPWNADTKSVTFTVKNRAPVLKWISPSQIYSTTSSQHLMVSGGHFNSETKLLLNGTKLQIEKRTSTLLMATLPVDNIVGSGTLSVVNPTPGGGKASEALQVLISPPAISSLSPGSVEPGAADFTLTVQGSHFDAAAAIYWDGNALTTSFVSDTELQATVPASDVVNAGVATVDVVNPPASGGISGHATFAIATGGTAVVNLSQSVDDIAWDPANFVLYAATSDSAATDPHAIVVIDPATAAIDTALDTTDTPQYLSVSSDSEFLYAAFNGDSGGGSIHRFSLPTLTDGLTIPLGVGGIGPNVPGGLAASPIYSHVFATIVDNDCCSPSNFGGGAVFLDGAGITVGGTEIWDVLSWSPDGTKLYSGDEESTARSFTIESVSVYQPTGQTFTWDLWAGGSLQVDAGTGLVYANSSDQVIDPVTSTSAGNFPVAGSVVPDSSLGCAYFIYKASGQTGSNYTIGCYDLTSFTLTRSAVLSNLNGSPRKLLRWGNEGLVFFTSTGYIYFVSGKVVTGN